MCYFVLVFNFNNDIYFAYSSDLVYIKRSQTTSYHNLGLRVLPYGLADYIQRISIGLVGYCTGVDYGYICGLAIFHLAKSCLLELLTNALAIVLINFTAQGNKLNSGH